MDAGSLILVLIVVACIMLLIILAKRQKDLEDEMFYEEDYHDDYVATMPVAEKKEEVKGPPQITMYRYCSNRKVKLCALCDGENDASATHCCICGNPLNK